MVSVFDADMAHDRAIYKSIVAACAALPVKTAETMAKATYEACRAAAKAIGQDPDIEVALRRPGEPRHFPGTQGWCVVWEAGPYEWAVPVSLMIGSATGKLCEPYYSFDLCFDPGED